MIERRELHLTPDAPWAGPAAYTEHDAPYFHGRTAETTEMLRLIRAEPVCVLHALSGLGKTSLLQAGVFPRLRADGWLPVRIRLDHRDLDDDGQPVPGLPAQVLAFIARAAQAQGCTVPAWDAAHDTLVRALHERGERLWGAREDEPVTPVLVFDQFEECWTQTREHPAARARAEALLGELAALIDWEPAPGRPLSDTAPLQPAPLRVVFSLREDQLAPLEALRPLFPGLRRARLRLLPFSATQAMEVVTGHSDPGAKSSDPEAKSSDFGAKSSDPEAQSAVPEAQSPLSAPTTPSSIRHSSFVIRHSSLLLDLDAADAIVSTFASADPDRPAADPALLSIFCWRLNEDRRARSADTITAARVTALRGEFVRQFYDDAFAQLSDAQGKAARRFVETDLIDAAGFRTSAGFEHAQKKYGVQPASLDRLVDARLLHPVDRSGGHRHVELVHDRIGEEALRQRTAREEAEAKAQADAAQAQAAEEKTRLQRDLARARRRALVLGALTVLALAALAFALVMYQQAIKSEQKARTAQANAEASEQRAIDARHEAEAATEKTKQALADARLQKLEADKQRAAAEAATKAVAAEKTRADQAKDKALAAKKSADELISFMQYDLRDTLGKVGRLDMMKSINDRIARYHQDHPPEKGDIKAEREQVAQLIQDGDLQRSLGNLKAAMESYQKSLAIAERLAQQAPGNADFQHILSVSYNRIGEALADAGEGKAALESYQKSLAIGERLAQQDPGNADWQRILSVSYKKIGEALADAGEGKAALESYQKSLAIGERLAQQDPGNAVWQSDLSVSYARIGNAQAAAGDGKAALESYQKSLAIIERLAQQDPGNAERQRDLSAIYLKIGETQAAAGDGKAALASYQKSLAIAERLAQQDPGNAGWQRDLSAIYLKIGETQAAAGDGKAALASYQKGLAIRERLAQQDASNVGWQRDLSVSYDNIGNAQAAAGDGKAALESYQKSLAIRERLAQQDPGNAGWQRDLSYSHFVISQTQEKLGDAASALQHAEASLKIDEKLAALDPTNATWQDDVKKSRAWLEQLRANGKK